jgi:hypothetical protein
VHGKIGLAGIVQGINVMRDDIELWTAVPLFEAYYEVSNYGRVRRISRAKGATLLKPLTYKWTKDKRYPRVGLSVNSIVTDFLVHLLVLYAFEGPPPEGTEADHIDGDTTNARLNNLRWLDIPTNRAQGNQRRTK